MLGDGREVYLISVIKENIITNKAIHMGLATNNFDEFVKQLTASKIPYSDGPGKPLTINIRTDSVRQIFFQDPDGYWVEVNNIK